MSGVGESLPPKRCSKCKEFKPLKDFNRAASSSGGYRSNCRDCGRKPPEPKEILPGGYKRCTKCKEVKLATKDFFTPDNACEYGVRSICKACRSAKEQEKLAAPEYREQRRAYLSGWWAEHRDEQAEKRKVWDEANPEYQRRYYEQYYPKNSEEVRARSSAYYYANREHLAPKRRRYGKRWRRLNREACLVRGRNYRARKLRAPGTHSAKDVEAKLELQGGLCYYCFRDLEQTGYHVDHKIPLVRGGSNWPANLAIACPPCNLSKCAKTPAEFREHRNRLAA